MTDLGTMLELFERNGTEFRSDTIADGEFAGCTVLTAAWGYGVYCSDGHWVEHAIDCVATVPDDLVRKDS